VLIAHGGAIVLLMALGAACAMFVERVRARRPEATRPASPANPLHPIPAGDQRSR